MSCHPITGCGPDIHNLYCGYPDCAKGKHNQKDVHDQKPILQRNQMAVYRNKAHQLVDAMQVTEDNILKVAEWCEGVVSLDYKRSTPFLHMSLVTKSGLTTVALGQWVVKNVDEFSVYSPEEFVARYEMQVAEVTDETIDRLLDEINTDAEGYDRYEYGLPIHSNDASKVMRETVRSWLRTIGGP